jgi:hypothetical protein
MPGSRAGTGAAIEVIEQGDRARQDKEADTMKKLNETSSAKINVLGEGELEQVVGGYCHRRRHCGGYKPRYNHCKKYEYNYEPSYTEESSEYESSDYSEPTEQSEGNSQIANVSVSVNINQFQG